jgi:hypothetical protein
MEPVQAINPATFTENSPAPTWNLVRVVFTGTSTPPSAPKKV